MVNKITLGSGFETFDIFFEDIGETVQISFNPADPNLSNRLFEAQKIIEEKAKHIKQYEVDENGVPNVDSCMECMNNANQIVYDAVDYAFGNKISDKIFKYCSPFAVVDGEYFMMHFFHKITPVLKNIIRDKQKKANANADKHLAKYRKR